MSLQEGGDAFTLVLITPLGVEIHAEDWHGLRSEFGQRPKLSGNLHGAPFPYHRILYLAGHAALRRRNAMSAGDKASIHLGDGYKCSWYLHNPIP